MQSREASRQTLFGWALCTRPQWDDHLLLSRSSPKYIHREAENCATITAQHVPPLISLPSRWHQHFRITCHNKPLLCECLERSTIHAFIARCLGRYCAYLLRAFSVMLRSRDFIPARYGKQIQMRALERPARVETYFAIVPTSN